MTTKSRKVYDLLNYIKAICVGQPLNWVCHRQFSNKNKRCLNIFIRFSCPEMKILALNIRTNVSLQCRTVTKEDHITTYFDGRKAKKFDEHIPNPKNEYQTIHQLQ